jgi:hypothetical protein
MIGGGGSGIIVLIIIAFYFALWILALVAVIGMFFFSIRAFIRKNKKWGFIHIAIGCLLILPAPLITNYLERKFAAANKAIQERDTAEWALHEAELKKLQNKAEQGAAANP